MSQGKHDIIMIAAEPWENSIWRRRHHVAWNLARDNRVLFVEPPFTVMSPLSAKIKWRHILNLGRLKYRGRNLYSYSPWKLLPLSLPGSYRFDYDSINRKIIFSDLKKIVEHLEFKAPVLWVYFSPNQYDYYGLFGEKIVVADWYDKFTAISGYDVPEEYILDIQQKERTILKNADLVFAVSEKLYADIKPLNNNVEIISQGVDYEAFQNAEGKEDKIISHFFEGIRKPVLGFLGMMHHIVDFELLNYIAQAHPDWSLLLMGPKNLWNKADIALFKMLSARKNVYYTGNVQRELIPIYLKYTDVCLMPMKKIEINRYASTLKLWEYMASGKPIVAIDQGIKYDCYELIRVASDEKEFVQAIDQCLKEEKGILSLSQKRKAVAEAHSWQKRVETMLELIYAELEENNKRRTKS